MSVCPVDGGDQDLYITFGALDGSGQPANASLYEPGRSHYDYKSAEWAAVSDQIEVSAGMAHFCQHCVIYIAVYGYKKGFVNYFFCVF